MNQLKGNSSHFPLLLVSYQDNGIFSWHHWVTANITHSLQINEQTSSNELPTKDHATSKVVGHGIRTSYVIWGTQWKMQCKASPLLKKSGKKIFLCSTVCLSSCHGVFDFRVLSAWEWWKLWDKCRRFLRMLGVLPKLWVGGMPRFTLPLPTLPAMGRGWQQLLSGCRWQRT